VKVIKFLRRCSGVAAAATVPPTSIARTFVRKLKLKSGREWRVYCRSGKKPDDIPSTPDGVYADAGWIGMPDWLGSSRYVYGARPFKKARDFVRSLGLKSQKEWSTYCRSGKKPNDIPAAPWQVYADDGWTRLVDWLGAGRRIGNWRPFNKARAFVRSLRLKNEDEWNAYCRSGKRPNDIPARPRKCYAAAGWIGCLTGLAPISTAVVILGARLRKHANLREHLDLSRAVYGTGTVATRLRKYRPLRKLVSLCVVSA
jgi:hypothetical protein